MPGFDPDALPDVTSVHYPRDHTPVPTDGLCELCGQPLRTGEPAVCRLCVQANPTIAAALNDPVNRAAR